jgi:hypothetical protein
MSLDHVKETLDVVACLRKLAEQIEDKAKDDGSISYGEAVQMVIEMMGSIGEAINGMGDVASEIANMCEADAKHLGGEAVSAMLALCKAFSKLQA